MTKNIQLRGHCQCCGNEQAVVAGLSSKHGYRVKHGWFTGICRGEFFAPIEKSRRRTDEIVAEVRADVALLLERVAGLNRGTIDPDYAKSGRKLEVVDNRQRWTDVRIPFKDGSYYEQQSAVEQEVRDLEYRAREGTNFANYLDETANKFHGQPLVEVERKAPAAQIQPGEKRDFGNGRVLTAKYQDKARVYYTNERGFIGWIGSRAWRALPLA